MNKKIFEVIVSTIFVVVVTFFINLAISKLTNEESILTLGESIKISDNMYSLTISINTYNTAIQDLGLGIPQTITRDQIRTNNPVELLMGQGNNIESNTFFQIKEIPEENALQLSLITHEKLDPDEIIINKNSNSLLINDLNSTKSPFHLNLLSVIITSVMYGLILLFSSLRDDKRRTELVAQSKEIAESTLKTSEDRYNDLKEYQEDLKNENQRLNQNMNDYISDYRKYKIIHMAKLNDYSKELNFWRNTIRKLIYETNSGKDKAEMVIKTVSSSLKTYQTLGQEHDFESLKVLSSLLNEKDKSKK